MQKGTKNGVSTGVDGTYFIQVKGKNAVLTFRMIGCEEQEVKVGDKKEINVTMKNQGVELDDVVVSNVTTILIGTDRLTLKSVENTSTDVNLADFSAFVFKVVK